MGPIGEYQKTSKYTYEGAEGKLDKITINVENRLKWLPAEKGLPASGGLPFKIVTVHHFS